MSFVPHWNVSAAVVERFDCVVPALERHAGMARALRAHGWVLVDHAASGGLSAAA